MDLNIFGWLQVEEYDGFVYLDFPLYAIMKIPDLWAPDSSRNLILQSATRC